MKRLKALMLVLAVLLGVAAVEGASGWTFQGCWSPFPTGTCYDVYTDSAGSYWRCAACGTTKNPNPNTCFRINPSIGYWCS